jgi:hypothetical protein
MPEKDNLVTAQTSMLNDVEYGSYFSCQAVVSAYSA